MTALPPIVVMGVSGSGKSTVGALLATRIGARFADGDDLHPVANKEKMAQGVPLTDADRVPWLEAIGRLIESEHTSGQAIVVACSALKRAYRDRLRSHDPDIVFVFLTGDSVTIAGRISGRQHEYMPPSLLDSQLATLEPLGEDEHHIDVDIAAEPERIIARITDALGAGTVVQAREPGAGARSAGAQKVGALGAGAPNISALTADELAAGIPNS